MRHATHIILTVLVFVFAFACAPDLELENNGHSYVNGYETIDGIYRVHVYEEEDTCYPIENEEDRIDRNSWLYVTVQEEHDNGGYLADLILADLVWYDAEVAPDGTLDAVTDIYGIFLYKINGLLTPDEVVATIDLDTVDANGDLMCRITYEINGFPLFVRETPPEGFYREALEDVLDLNPFDN